MQPGKEPPTPAPGCLTLGPHVARRWEGLALWVLSHTRVEGRGGRAGSGHLATLPGLRTARAAGALFLPPNQQLNCRGNIAASSTRPEAPPRRPSPCRLSLCTCCHLPGSARAHCPPPQPQRGAPPSPGESTARGPHSGPAGSCLTKQAPHLQAGP